MSKLVVAYASSIPLVAGSFACGPGPTSTTVADTPRASATSTDASVPPPLVQRVAVEKRTAAELQDAIRERVVDADHVARRALYSWTTRDQAEAIVSGRPLLTRVASPDFGPSAYDWELDERVGKNDRLAKLLFREGFAKKRFAWPNAYATAPGAGAGRYGSVLLRMELSPDALIVDLSRSRVLAVDGKEVSLDELEKRPDRLAAVHWHNTGFREYVIVNATALATVSFGTAKELEVFEAERAFLSDLTRSIDHLSESDRGAVLRAFANTLAFQSAADEALLRSLAREADEVPPDALSFTLPRPADSFALGSMRARLVNPNCKMKIARDYSYRRQFCAPEDRCTLVRATNTCQITKTRVPEE